MKERNIAVSIILTLVTCGIYGLYWLIVLNDEVKQATKHDEFQTGGIVLLLTIVTCGIYGIYWSYKMGEFIDKAKNSDNTNTGILYLILSILGLDIIVYALIQNELNNMIDEKKVA